MTNLFLEVLATLIYMFVVFPIQIVLTLLFMVLCTILLPIHIPFIKKKVLKYISTDKSPVSFK